MFTGLVQEKGGVRLLKKKRGDLLVEIACSAAEISIGESIAVNGACLTVEEKSAASFRAFISAETITKTTFADLKIGEPVNLERALRLGAHLGGHIVTGHIDTIGKILAIRSREGSLVMDIAVTKDFSHYTVAKGSIAIDGVSLTINECDDDAFSVNIIPMTARATTLGDKKNGALLNIEFDIIGKYVERFISARLKDDKPRMGAEFLAKHGFI